MHQIDSKFVKLSLFYCLLGFYQRQLLVQDFKKLFGKPHLDSYYFHLHAQSNEANFFPTIQFPVFSQPIDQIFGKHTMQLINQALLLEADTEISITAITTNIRKLNFLLFLYNINTSQPQKPPFWIEPNGFSITPSLLKST